MTADGGKTYIYDASNRLTEVKNSGGSTIASFEYDADGRRTKMVTATATTKFYYDGDSTRVLYETDASNNIIAQYAYDSTGQLVSMTRGGATYYYHFNGHGDVVALTNSSGTVVATYDYDAFGNLLSSSGTVVNQYRYAGYRYDTETGLYYLNARYYAPQIGRFINRDDFHGFEDEPESLNQYNYAHGNPVMNVDPDGHIAAAIGAGLGLGLGLGAAATIGLGLVAVGATAYLGVTAYKAYQASKSRSKSIPPKSEPNIKGQGKERLEKKKQNPKNWVDRSNKKLDRPIRPKSHKPGNDHRKY